MTPLRFPSVDELFPIVRLLDGDAEAATLGAMITGALRARDVRRLDPLFFANEMHASAFPILTRAINPKRPGILIVDAVIAWVRAGLPTIRGRWRVGALHARAWLTEIARAAPRRPEALSAARQVLRLAAEREELHRRREKAIANFNGWAREAARFAWEIAS